MCTVRAVCIIIICSYIQICISSLSNRICQKLHPRELQVTISLKLDRIFVAHMNVIISSNFVAVKVNVGQEANVDLLHLARFCLGLSGFS